MSRPIESLESRRLFAAGAADPSFGDSGSVSLKAALNAPTDAAKSRPTQMVVDSAGRTVVLSYSAGTVNITRLTPDGTPDRRFAIASGGVLAFTGPSDPDDYKDVPRRIAVDKNNRIYLNFGRSISRYTSSGKLDRTFGEKGSLSYFEYNDELFTRDITIDGSGAIYAIGTSEYELGSRLELNRFSADGQFFPKNFVTPGTITVPEPLDPDIRGEAVDTGINEAVRTLADGSVMAVHSYVRSEDATGDTYKIEVGTLVSKFLPSGKLDKSYGKNGRAAFRTVGQSDNGSINVNADPVGIRSDGSVVLKVKTANQPAYNFTLNAAGRYGGSVDFGNVLTTAQFVRQREDRELLLDVDRGTLVRLNADGTRDTSFDAPGQIKNVTAATVAGDGGVIFGDAGRDAEDAKFSVRRVYGSEAPAGRLVPATLVGRTKKFPFRVLWRDDDGVDLDSISGHELRVIASDGSYVGARLTGKTVSKGYVVADYYFARNDGHAFSSVDNGVYDVRLRANTVRDVNGAASETRTLGSLVVSLA